MIALELGALVLAAVQAVTPQDEARSREFVVEGQGGLFMARLAKAPGQERVADALARWKLAVRDSEGREQWSCFHPAPDDSLMYVLAEDGATFASVDPRWSDSRPVVTLRSGPDEPARVFGGELGIARDVLRAREPAGAWLAEDADAVRFTWILGPAGPRQMLSLACCDGVQRTIDLESGRSSDAGGGLVRVWVEPAFEQDSVPPSRVPPVSEVSIPPRAVGDEALVVVLRGEYANPGWRIFAFALEPGEDGVLQLTPRARPPLPPGVQVQQIEPYETEARIFGLPPGEHSIVVHGEHGPVGPPAVVTVSPGGVLARLRTRGGILGLDETLTLFENGVVERVSNRPAIGKVAFAPPRAFAEARALLSRLPALEPAKGASIGSDFLAYELTWRVAGEWRTLVADDGNARGELRETLAAVRRLAPE